MPLETYNDSLSNDYMSDSSSDDIEYHKVTLKKPLKNDIAKNKDTKLTKTNGCNDNSNNGKDTKEFTLKYINHDSNNKSNNNKRIRMSSLPSDTTTKKKRDKFRNVKFYETGDTISGYKFVTDEPPPLKKQNKTRKRDTINIDPFQFDRLDGVKRYNYKRTPSTETVITEYWNNSKNTKREDMYIPIIINGNNSFIKLCQPIRIEDITSENVFRFYEYSEQVMNYSIQQMLKEDRIKWHPDKLLDNENKIIVTRLFQIINDLWQSQTSS